MIARHLAVAVLLLACAGTARAAADYPVRPIRIIAPFPPGGTVDVIIRGPADQLAAQLGQPVIIDNRGGANGIIGTDIAAKAPGDGYTLLVVTAGTHVLNPSLYRNLPYDTLRDFAPITSLALSLGSVVVVNPRLPARSIAELIALDQQPGSDLMYGSPGFGNQIHLLGELFNQRTGTHLRHIPYKGVGPLIAALLAGEVHVTIIPPIAPLEHLKAGTLRALAFTGSARWAELPDLPTMAQAGVADFVVEGGFIGLFAPSRTPRAIIERLHGEVVKALAVPRIADAIRHGGYVPDGRPPDAFGAFVRDEVAHYAELVRETGIQPE